MKIVEGTRRRKKKRIRIPIQMCNIQSDRKVCDGIYATVYGVEHYCLILLYLCSVCMCVALKYCGIEMCV